MGKSIRRTTESKSAPRPPTGSASGYGEALFAIIEKKLKASSKRRNYIPPEQLARALRENPGVPVPPEIQDYLCDFLEGKIRAPAGRRPDSESAVSQINKALIPPKYARYHAWLKQRKRSMGLEGWKFIRAADWWQGPPYQRAARMVGRRLGLAMDWRRVRNIVSEANKKR